MMLVYDFRRVRMFLVCFAFYDNFVITTRNTIWFDRYLQERVGYMIKRYIAVRVFVMVDIVGILRCKGEKQ